MPRGPRKKSMNGIYHVIQRGINKQMIFEDDDDRIKLLETIKKYKVVCNYQIYAYCLMDNHIHLLIKENGESISEAIKRISASYVYWYNNKSDRCGHLFQGRFDSECVESLRYFFTVLRYIHQNPVKAGISKNVFEAKWTSMNEYLRKPTLVDVDLPLQLFSPDRSKAINHFIDYMQEPNDDQCLDDFEKVRMSDDEVKNHLFKMGIKNISVLQQMKKEDRDALISKIKGLDGISIRQLSRVTGISKSVIGRVKVEKD